MQKKKTIANVSYWSHESASSQTLLFIHGFTGSHKGFDYITQHLHGYSYIIPDLPGFGTSDLFDKPWTIDNLAKKTNDFVRSLQFAKPPIVISHSMGGLVAASMLAQNPELFAQKTVFISPVATKVSNFEQRKLGELGGRLQYGIGKKMPFIVKSKRLSSLATTLLLTTKDPALMKRIHAHHHENLEYISSIAFYHALHRDINRRGATDYAYKLRGFTPLVIAGDRDNVTPIKTEKLFAKVIDADLKIIPDVGHLMHYERPREAAAAIVEFLNS